MFVCNRQSSAQMILRGMPPAAVSCVYPSFVLVQLLPLNSHKQMHARAARPHCTPWYKERATRAREFPLQVLRTSMAVAHFKLAESWCYLLWVLFGFKKEQQLWIQAFLSNCTVMSRTKSKTTIRSRVRNNLHSTVRPQSNTEIHSTLIKLRLLAIQCFLGVSCHEFSAWNQYCKTSHKRFLEHGKWLPLLKELLPPRAIDITWKFQFSLSFLWTTARQLEIQCTTLAWESSAKHKRTFLQCSVGVLNYFSFSLRSSHAKIKKVTQAIWSQFFESYTIFQRTMAIMTITSICL